MYFAHHFRPYGITIHTRMRGDKQQVKYLVWRGALSSWFITNVNEARAPQKYKTEMRLLLYESIKMNMRCIL